jgi:4,5-DOPA dioxygenase extradiol
VRVGASARPATIHDFGGFPAELYRLEYPAPGDPALAGEVAGLLEGAGIAAVLDPERGLDHGAWVPLRFLYPAADVPIVPVSLPRPRDGGLALRIGRALTPLADRGVLLLGSGGIVHNLARLRFGEENAPVDPWARAFEDWIIDRLTAGDEPALLAYRSSAPGADLAVPTPEHFDPLLFALGAGGPGADSETLHEGFQYANLSLRALAFQPRPGSN